jgi:hypothetical protein
MSYVTMAHSGKLIMATNSAAPLAQQNIIPSPLFGRRPRNHWLGNAVAHIAQRQVADGASAR